MLLIYLLVKLEGVKPLIVFQNFQYAVGFLY